MSGGGVAFNQALESQGNTNSSEPVVKYKTGGGIADLDRNRNVDSLGIRHFIEGGYTNVGDVEGIDAYDSGKGTAAPGFTGAGLANDIAFNLQNDTSGGTYAPLNLSNNVSGGSNTFWWLKHHYSRRHWRFWFRYI